MCRCHSVYAALKSSVLRTILNEVKLSVFYTMEDRQFQRTGAKSVKEIL